MPIRFRCVYCDKLLGIARRKAGAVVNCPHCAEKLIVPTPEPDAVADPSEEEARATADDPVIAAAAAGGGGGRLFEHSDFDALLRSEPTFRTLDEGSAPALPSASPGYSSQPPPVPPPYQAPRPAPSPFLQSEPQAPPGYVISPSRATWLSVAVVVLCAIFFGGGLIVGRMLK